MFPFLSYIPESDSLASVYKKTVLMKYWEKPIANFKCAGEVICAVVSYHYTEQKILSTHTFIHSHSFSLSDCQL